jgi:hypothetical protein
MDIVAALNRVIRNDSAWIVDGIGAAETALTAEDRETLLEVRSVVAKLSHEEVSFTTKSGQTLTERDLRMIGSGMGAVSDSMLMLVLATIEAMRDHSDSLPEDLNLRMIQNVNNMLYTVERGKKANEDPRVLLESLL